MNYISIMGLDVSKGDTVIIKTKYGEIEYKVVDERYDSFNRAIHDLIEVKA